MNEELKSRVATFFKSVDPSVVAFLNNEFAFALKYHNRSRNMVDASAGAMCLIPDCDSSIFDYQEKTISPIGFNRCVDNSILHRTYISILQDIEPVIFEGFCSKIEDPPRRSKDQLFLCTSGYSELSLPKYDLFLRDIGKIEVLIDYWARQNSLIFPDSLKNEMKKYGIEGFFVAEEKPLTKILKSNYYSTSIGNHVRVADSK